MVGGRGLLYTNAIFDKHHNLVIIYPHLSNQQYKEMSETFEWCQDKTKLAIWDKQVFFVSRYGDKCWYLNGQRHRVNGPAIEYADGTKRWYLNDKLHRENGPAVEYADGEKWWWLNGLLHRENGPAVEYADGTKKWYLNGRCYTESAYWKEINK